MLYMQEMNCVAECLVCKEIKNKANYNLFSESLNCQDSQLSLELIIFKHGVNCG